MTLLDQATRLGRLGVLLQLHDAVVAPVLAAITAVPRGTVMVGTVAGSRRVELVMPYHPDAFAALAPGLAVPAGPHLGLRVRIDQDAISMAVTVEGGGSDAIRERATTSSAGPAWVSLIEQFCSVAGGRVAGHAIWVDPPARATAQIRYPDRDRAADAVLMLAVDQLAGEIGVTAAQRRLWARIHPDLGRGREIVVETGLTANAVSSQLSISYPVTEWELATRLSQGLILNDSDAQAVPSQLGAMAGALGADAPTSVTLELGPHEPVGVLVWAALSPVI
jgi:hypothetical protein